MLNECQDVSDIHQAVAECEHVVLPVRIGWASGSDETPTRGDRTAIRVLIGTRDLRRDSSESHSTIGYQVPAKAMDAFFKRSKPAVKNAKLQPIRMEKCCLAMAQLFASEVLTQLRRTGASRSR